MENDEEFIKRLILAKTVLSDIPLKEKYHSAGLVRNGKLIEKTVVGEFQEFFHELTRKVEIIMGDGFKLKEKPEDITITYSQNKVFFKRLEIDNESEPFWLMVYMESNVRAFKRFLEKALKRLKILLY